MPAKKAGTCKGLDRVWYNEAGAITGTTISTSNGIGSTAITNVAITATGVGQVVTLDTTSAGVGLIGAGAIVQLTFTQITNPATVGAYGVTVATHAETTAVASNTITTTVPTITPVPGVITVWNSAGVELAQTVDFMVALNDVTAGGTIKLTAGTYNTNFANANAGQLALSMTIQGTDPSAANVILMSTAPWALTGKTVVINAVTVDGSGPGALTIGNTNASGTDTISGCNFQNGALIVNDSGSGVVCTLSNDTFTTKTGALVGLNAMTPATVTGCKFNVAGTSWGISAAANVTVTGSTFTGVAETTDTYLGNGISITGGTGNAISTSTFTGLTNALTVNGGTAMANFFNNTVTNCGEASPPALTATDQTTSAIIITAAAANGVNIYGNTITAGTYYVLSVATGNDSNVNFYQNTLTGNAKIASNDDLNNTLMLTKNWWGGAANVPANVKLVAGTTAGLTFAPALGAAPSATAFAVNGSLSASATVGVNVSDSGDAAYEIGATALAGNPTAIAIPSADTATKYFDVYGQTPTAGNLTGATVDFYGTTAIPVVNTPTSASAVLFYNSTTGAWVNAGGMINAFGNYVEIYVGSVPGQTAGLSAAQFNGTPFVLVTQVIPLGTIVGTATPLYPINGAVNVPVANLTFTWPAVTGTGVTYQFALAQASANTSANEFAILDYSDNTTTNAEPSQETLAYNTVYWWEVRAVTMNSSGGIAATGPWSIQMFTTMPMPTTTTSAPVVTITQTNTSVIVTQPVTTVQSTVTSVVITQTTGTSTQAIPSYLLWAVIAVGAILVIAVIVLIVRTRRIP